MDKRTHPDRFADQGTIHWPDVAAAKFFTMSNSGSSRPVSLSAMRRVRQGGLLLVSSFAQRKRARR